MKRVKKDKKAGHSSGAFRKVAAMAIFSVLAGSLALWAGYLELKNERRTAGEPVKTESVVKKPVLVSGPQDYKIVQPENVWPKILDAKIDPPDVRLGDIQKLSLTVLSEAEIVSVRADIETDNGIIELPLSLSKTAPGVTDINRPFVLDKDNVLRERNDIAAENFIDSFSARAALSPLLYVGEWKVRDTHDTTYHTTFVARDSRGRENSITIAWTDVCGITNGGAWSSSSDCVISSPDGVDNGNATITAGRTLTLNAPFIINPGNALIVNGAIAIGGGGSIVKGYLWQCDNESDNYAAPTPTLQCYTTTSTAPLSCGGGILKAAADGSCDSTNTKAARRRSLLVTAQYDCDDGNASIYPGITTSSGSCSCGSYPSTCATSVSGSASSTVCSANGTYTTSSSGCTCTRSTDGTSCGTTTTGSCTPSSTCSGSGSQSQTTYSCSAGSCVSNTTSVSCSVTPASAGTSCGTTSYGAWGAWGSCTGSGSCPTSGTQSRVRSKTTYACNGSGSCIATNGTDSESQSCSINPAGWSCGTSVQSDCTWPYGTCVNVGDFTTTYYECTSSGTCGTRTQAGTCLRNTDGTSCGSCNTCVSGSCQPGC